MTIIHTKNTEGKPLMWSAKEDWQESQDLLQKYAGLSAQADMSKYYTNEYLSAPPYTAEKVKPGWSPLRIGVAGRPPSGRFDTGTTKPMSEPYIRLPNVGKKYETKSGPIEACSDINLDIRQSEFVAIVGPSGCGKTTILKMVAGLAPYTSGMITVGGKRVDCPQTDVGIVFQEAIMLDWRDVLENVMLQIDIRKMDRTKYEAIARKSAEGHGS